MKDINFDEFDEINRPAPEAVEFDQLANNLMNHRQLLRGGVMMGASALVMGGAPVAAAAIPPASRLGFEAVAANTLDTVTVPSGYNWQVVATWGEPMWSQAPAFDAASRGTATSQALAFGDNNDGMAMFRVNGKNVLVVNNEYTNRGIMWGNRASKLPESADDVNKGKAAHGVSVIEVSHQQGQWQIIKDSPLNRRITPDTDMAITGPATGHPLMRTTADPKGVTAKGTWNNCGNGQTPWGTYLTCEENFNGYFSASDENYPLSRQHKRYGISHKDWGYGWAQTDERFDVSKNPNEPNRAGYIVEIDPANPTAKPRKLTALGRFKHENAELVMAADGRIVVYMGDDERGEFLYRYVSHGKYQEGGNNDELLEKGTIYVAKFFDDMNGVWLPLTPETTGMSEAEICIYTRDAASMVGATTMDRPEWVAANPNKVEAYCALTNNKNRGKKPNKGGDATPVDGANPRAANNYGQIVRWLPINQDHAADVFIWDLFVMAGNPTQHNDIYKGSNNINADNMFNSPDGLAFDKKGLIWIQTDGNYSNEGDFAGQGNNQMLVGDPATGEIRRFMVGPKECEVTGFAWTADQRTLFVGIQHPGEKGNSNFPAGGDSLPRSCVIAISREDGAVIG